MSKIVQLEIPFDFEEFKDIENYEGLYQISNFGRVYSLISNKFLKPQSDKDGYLYVGFSKNKKQKFYRIHRLVAQAFIPNPLNLPEVNHINEVKSDNRVENLEFCDTKYNTNYGTRTIRILQHPNTCIKQPKSVLQFTRQGEFVKEFPSIHEASRQTKINQNNISECCNEKRKSAGNYLWRFKDVS